MGAPNINISFIGKAVSAVTRGERGTVMLWVRDSLPEGAENPVAVVTAADIPASLSDGSSEQAGLAMIGYVNAPKKVFVYCMGIEDEAQAEEVDAGYKRAMEASETIRFDYLAAPTVETDGKTQEVAAWVKTMRGNKKKIKAVLPNMPADNEGIINYTTGRAVKTETSIAEGGVKLTEEKVYSAEQYCSRIAGLIAGTPVEISCTYAPLPELSDCERLKDIDAPVDKGEFIIFHDGEKVKAVRGVNSLVTLTGDKGESFKKIKIVETMDMIHDDIIKTAQDSYLGRYANTYSNKCLLLSAISEYFMQLQKDAIISSYSVQLDAEAIRSYLKSRGLEAALEDGTVKEADECSDEEIKTADTGSNVFLTGSVKILDAIEDITMPISI